MSIEIKMPALSPTMEEGTLAKWLVKEGDTVKSGDIMAEIETDKATMEFEAVDEGVIAKILVAEGSDNVKVGTVIAILAEEGEDASAVQAPTSRKPRLRPTPCRPTRPIPTRPAARPSPPSVPSSRPKITASPLIRASRPAMAAARSPARWLAASPRKGSRPVGRDRLGPEWSHREGGRRERAAGPGQGRRSRRADLSSGGSRSRSGRRAQARAGAGYPARSVEAVEHAQDDRASPDRSKQQVPHIYLTVDIRLDALLKLRGELNAGLESRGVKLSVNDMLIKALGVSLMAVPKCNVMFTPDQLISFKRADISVAVSTPAGLITPIVSEADTRSLSSISTTMKDLATRARDNKLQPHEFRAARRRSRTWACSASSSSRRSSTRRRA